MSIVLGIMGITNLAHGALFMIGAYMGWTIASKLDLPCGLALVVGGPHRRTGGSASSRGSSSEPFISQPNEQVLVTFGFVLVIGNVILWIWGAGSHCSTPPTGSKGRWRSAGVFLAKTGFSSWSVGLVVAAVLWFVQDRTRIGAMVRAGMDDKEMTRDSASTCPLVSAGVFFLASFLAGFAGVMGSRSSLRIRAWGLTPFFWPWW